MKAVIMAGGEGTRLRPLTSNAPKPMLPLVNRADDGAHRRPAEAARLRRDRRHRRLHGQRTSATYFGDGSEFGVRMVYATEETPLGTAGSVRNAMDELDERFLVISGDVLTDIDLSRHRRRSTTSSEALATIGLVRVENPLEFGIVITQRGRLDRALPREADVGPGVQRHHQHRHLRARARDLRLHRSRPAGRLLQRGVPGAARRRQAALRRRRRGLLGGRRHARGLRRRPQGHPRRQGRRSTSPASSSADGVWLGEGAEIHPDADDRRARRSSATTAASRPARASAEYTVLGANVRVRGRRRPRARRRPRQRLPRRGRAPAGRRRRPGLRPAQRRARARRASVLGDECFVGEDAVLGRGRQGLPVQDGRGRARSSTPRSCGSRRGARSLFGRGGRGRAGQRRHHPRARRPGGDGLRHHAQEGRHGHHVAATRAGRPACSSGR